MISVVTRSFSKDFSVSSNEEQAASDLKEMLQNELKRYPSAKGTIYILSSIHLFGQKRNDIDILVIGFFDGFVITSDAII